MLVLPRSSVPRRLPSRPSSISSSPLPPRFLLAGDMRSLVKNYTMFIDFAFFMPIIKYRRADAFRHVRRARR